MSSTIDHRAIAAVRTAAIERGAGGIGLAAALRLAHAGIDAFDRFMAQH